MKKLVIVALFSLGTTLSISASAKDKDYDKAYKTCMNNGGKSINNAVVYDCSEQISEQAKAEINRLYQKTYRRWTSEAPENADKLEESQKTWLQYRETYCELLGNAIGTPMAYVCRAERNILRTKELRQLSE